MSFCMVGEGTARGHLNKIMEVIGVGPGYSEGSKLREQSPNTPKDYRTWFSGIVRPPHRLCAYLKWHSFVWLV